MTLMSVRYWNFKDGGSQKAKPHGHTLGPRLMRNRLVRNSTSVTFEKSRNIHLVQIYSTFAKIRSK